MSAGARRIVMAAVLVLMASVTATAWQWPVPLPRVTGTFGQDAGGYLLRGIEFGGEAQPVFPVERGRVIATHADRGSLPSALGTYVVIEHEQAFRSIYAHLDADLLPTVGRNVDVDTQIGTVGHSGHVTGRTLRLYVLDLESGDYVNPMLLLPDLEDTVRPRIGAVYARSTGALYDLRERTMLPPGEYEITADIVDALSPRSEGLAPYAVRMFVAGEEVFHAAMDRIVVRPDSSRIEPGGVGASALYGVQGLMRLGTLQLNTGPTELELVATDFVGNEASLRLVVTGVVDGVVDEDL